MAMIKNKFCQNLISNNASSFDWKAMVGDNLIDWDDDSDDFDRENFIYKQYLNIINNPKIICDYIKDQYFKNVLAIKYKGVYLYNMLFAEHNKMLWDYLFDENKMLFFVYRLTQEKKLFKSRRIIKYINHQHNFNYLMENIQQYFYQTSPNTELGKYLKKLKNGKGWFNVCMVVNRQKKWVSKLQWQRKLKDEKHNYIKDFNHIFKNFNYINLYARTFNSYYGNNGTETAGTHFDYLMNLTKSCLVWDCNKDDFRKDRINDIATYMAFDIMAKIVENKYLSNKKHISLDDSFMLLKKKYGNHFLYNIAKKNMEKWWRNFNESWLSNAKCSLCDCDIVIKSKTEQAAKLAVGCYGYCSRCHKIFYKKNQQGEISSDSDSDSDINVEHKTIRLNKSL